MKRKTPRFASVLGLAGLSLASAVWAQENPSALSLDQAVQEGLRQSPTLQSAAARVKTADGQKIQGLSDLLPQVHLAAVHSLDYEYENVPVDIAGNDITMLLPYPVTDLKAEAQWTIFNGLSNLRHFEAAELLSRASQEAYDRKRFEVRRQIEMAFYEALAAVKFHEVAQQNYTTVSENLDRVKALLDNGEATSYDVLRVQVLYNEAQVDVQKTADDIVINQRKLTEVMGRSVEDRLLEGNLPVPGLVEQVAAVTAPAPQDRPDLRAAELRSEAADKEDQAALGGLLPSVKLTARYEYYDNTDEELPGAGNYRDAYDVGVSLQWDILDGGRSYGKVLQEDGVRAQQAAEYQQQALTLPSDFELWKRRYLYSAQDFDAKKSDLVSSQESYRIAQAGYRSGTKTISDVLDAEADLFRSREGVIRAELAAQEALNQLELTIGKEIRS